MPMLKYALIILLVTLSSCNSSEPLDEKAWLENGKQTLQPFKQELKAALMAGMKQGPEQAIEICQLQAPAIVNELDSSTFTLGRTSHKLRNPSNAPQAWMKPLLEDYLAEKVEKAPRVVELPQGRIGYVEPIYLKPVCLSCHGRQIDPAIQAKIDTAYPQDQATGFKAGDFRGMFWVEFTSQE